MSGGQRERGREREDGTQKYIEVKIEPTEEQKQWYTVCKQRG